MDTWLDPELTGLPGATTVAGYHGGGRVPARGAWVRRVPVSASGYKNPKVLGGAGCGTTSERPRRGYSKRATLGGCSAGTVPRSARRLGASRHGCFRVQNGRLGGQIWRLGGQTKRLGGRTRRLGGLTWRLGGWTDRLGGQTGRRWASWKHVLVHFNEILQGLRC